MRVPVRGFWPAVVGLMLAVGLAACGSDSGSGGSGGSSGPKVVSYTPPESGCGSFSLPAGKDPAGFVKTLPADMQANYEGYVTPIEKSAWSNWKPKHGPPYDIGVQFPMVSNDFMEKNSSLIVKELEKDPDIGNVKFQSTGDQLDVAQELQQYQSMVRSKPDLIVLVQVQPNAFAKPIEDAGKAGIPTLVLFDSAPGKYAVNVNTNMIKGPATILSGLVRLMESKGNLMLAHGVPGNGADNNANVAIKAVLDNCPDIKTAGDIYGNYSANTAKGEALKFLASHPQKIDGVMQVGGMASGISSAFQSTGRPVPAFGDLSPSKASLAYWDEHIDEYRATAATVPPQSIAKAVARITTKMLAGDGVLVDDIVGFYTPINADNLNQFVEESWTTGTPGDPPGTADGYLSPSQVDKFFKK